MHLLLLACSAATAEVPLVAFGAMLYRWCCLLVPILGGAVPLVLPAAEKISAGLAAATAIVLLATAGVVRPALVAFGAMLPVLATAEMDTPLLASAELVLQQLAAAVAAPLLSPAAAAELQELQELWQEAPAQWALQRPRRLQRHRKMHSWDRTAWRPDHAPAYKHRCPGPETRCM